MIDFESALAATLAASAPLQLAEMTPVWALVGRVIAQDLQALEDSPTADVSLKDGYAVSSDDVAAAAPDHPIALRLAGHVAAGGSFVGCLEPGSAVRILSGAPLPMGATAVLAEEFAVSDGERISALADAAPGRNVLRRGHDLTNGDRIIRAGTLVRPAQVGLLAAAGYSEVPVIRRPRVALVATGDELVGLEKPADASQVQSRTVCARLEAGRVFASNLATMNAWCRHYGIETSGSVVPDEPDVLRAALLEALTQNDAVVTSGGAWSGERDLVVGILEELGWRMIYHRVRLGPGKGAGFGLWQGKQVFVLPGGPASNQMGFLQLALPGLHRLMGFPHPGLPTRPARLAADVTGQEDWTEFIEGRFEWEGAELLFVPGKGRSRLRSMAACEGYLRKPTGITRLEAGTLVAVQLLPDVPAIHEALEALDRAPSGRRSPVVTIGAATSCQVEGGTGRALPDAAPEAAPEAAAEATPLEPQLVRQGGPLIVSMVGRSGMGKTTFLERLLPCLKALGLRVGILKHHAHPSPFDVPGKDTFRMSEAGADLVVGVCSTQTAVFIPGDASADLEGVLRRNFDGVDLVLTEGYKRGPYPKIELRRAERAAQIGQEGELLCRPEELLAVVTDEMLPLPATTPQYGLEDAQGVAQLLARLVAGGTESLPRLTA